MSLHDAEFRHLIVKVAIKVMLRKEIVLFLLLKCSVLLLVLFLFEIEIVVSERQQRGWLKLLFTLEVLKLTRIGLVVIESVIGV
jgi:hypothetical protein